MVFLKKLAICCLLLIVTTLVKASDWSIEALSTMEQEINLDPWKAYQKLTKQPVVLSSQNTDIYLWWMMRKAQSENLLYFYDDFNQTTDSVINLVNQYTPPKVASTLYFFQGLKNRRAAKYADARKSLKKAMSIASQHELHHAYILAKQEHAYTQSITELFETSLRGVQQAYVEAYALNDEFLIAVINETYGAIYGYMEDYQQSIEYYQKALDTYERLQYKAHIAEAIYGLASTYRYWKKYDLASEKYELYQKRVSYTPNKEITYFGAYGLAMTYAEAGRCDKALETIDLALAFEGIEDYDAELYKSQARCYIKLGNLIAAERALQHAEQIFAKMPELENTTWTVSIIKIRADLAFASRDYEQAFDYLNSYEEQNTAMLLTNASSRLLNVRTSLEQERFRVESALYSQRETNRALTKENEKQHTQNQQFIVFFVSVLLLIAITIVIVLYRNNKKMVSLTITDHLSGLYNRRYVFEYLDKLLATVSPEKGELVVMLIDIDDFKEINDKYGHPIGDKVIKGVSQIAMSVLRAEDVVGRIGGEEFFCITPRTGIEQAQNIAERMLIAVSEHEFVANDNEPFAVTISIGIAPFGNSAQFSSVLYNHADKALYQAKSLGKNKVVTFDEES